ncbi:MULTISPECIES: cation:proton antiporter domain-containing protein [Streptomyces]|uniref:cation:proton antiporter domain-containing protein n=1 Tax=Streptomyces TaxID=1883 RepID=UPI0029A42BFB|nr:cation:proton antiporter [Streptomyces sp. WI03-4A]MDX2596270.1 cation:proton antiporter [Streptomyces sp. WI03-4A]
MTGGAAGASGPLDPTAAFLLGLSALLFLTYGAGRAARAAGLPPVVAEMAVGLLAGPSLLGALAPGAHRLLFGPGTLPALDTLAQLGVTLYALGIGRRLGRAEETPDGARETHGEGVRGGTVVVLAAVSFGVPMVAGVLLALGPVGRFAGPRTGTTGFALFLGCALSVTALPVLARLLEAAGLTRTRVGRLSLGAAAAGDAAAWCTLTAALVVSGAVRSGRLVLAGCGLAAVAVLWWASRGRRARRPGAGLVLPAAGGVLAGGASAALGLHQLFGALLFGFLYGRLRPGPAPGLDMLEQVAAAVLLPCFFLGYGQRLDLGAFDWSGTTLAVVGAVVAVACAVKTAGCAAVGALRGLPAAEWLRLAVLMNSRGLTELVVLSVGYQAGLIDRTLLIALTLMALLTTALVGPGLTLLDRLRPLDAAPGTPAGGGAADRVRVEA